MIHIMTTDIMAQFAGKNEITMIFDAPHTILSWMSHLGSKEYVPQNRTHSLKQFIEKKLSSFIPEKAKKNKMNWSLKTPYEIETYDNRYQTVSFESVSMKGVSEKLFSIATNGGMLYGVIEVKLPL